MARLDTSKAQAETEADAPNDTDTSSQSRNTAAQSAPRQGKSPLIRDYASL